MTHVPTMPIGFTPEPAQSRTSLLPADDPIDDPHIYKLTYIIKSQCTNFIPPHPMRSPHQDNNDAYHIPRFRFSYRRFYVSPAWFLPLLQSISPRAKT